MDTETKSTKKLEGSESFIKISKSLAGTKKLSKNGELDVYHLAIIKSLANNGLYWGCLYNEIHRYEYGTEFNQGENKRIFT
ncbi:hypothetical protein [Bacillus cereus]|uniref:hypothetical protein n=1 Tax=Bacillus cereus TaxID=1396 RepID=UPI00119DD501|nr:hypothetical protein [Bacillus cereus]